MLLCNIRCYGVKFTVELAYKRIILFDLFHLNIHNIGLHKLAAILRLVMDVGLSAGQPVKGVD